MFKRLGSLRSMRCRLFSFKLLSFKFQCGSPSLTFCHAGKCGSLHVEDNDCRWRMCADAAATDKGCNTNAMFPIY